MSRKAMTWSVDRIMKAVCVGDSEIESEGDGPDSGSLKGVGGFVAAMLQNGHVSPMMIEVYYFRD